MMNNISQQQLVVDPLRTGSRPAQYTFWGAVIGVIAGLATLFTVSTSYAATMGLDALNCAAFGSMSTLLLSQPIALVGIAVGAACGGTCALVVHLVHRSQHSG